MIDFYTGCYTTKLSTAVIGRGNGIVQYQFDPEGKSLTKLSSVALRNPTYMAGHPVLPVIYVVEELPIEENPQVCSFIINRDGSLAKLNSQRLKASYGCHLRVVHDHLIISNYGSGSISVFPLRDHGALGQQSDECVHIGSGPNKDRQEAAHAHMICSFREDIIYVADLGIDACKAYCLTSGKLKARPAYDLVLPAGSGPRHMVKHPVQELIYVLGELNAKVYTLEVKPGTPKVIQVDNILSNDSEKIPGAAAIRISPDGKNLYASERTTNSLAHFRLDKNGLPGDKRIIQLVDKTPRDFNLTKDAKWLIVAGQDSDTLSFYEIGDEGSLTYATTFDQVIMPIAVYEV